MPKSDPELDQLPVDIQRVELAVPKRHALTKLKKLRLRDLTDVPFVWFPRRVNPTFSDPLMHECYRGGLKAPPLTPAGLKSAPLLRLGYGRFCGRWGICTRPRAAPPRHVLFAPGGFG